MNGRTRLHRPSPRTRTRTAARTAAEGAGSMGTAPSGGCGIWLYWLPLGAGGWFVRMNGRIYESIRAVADHRPPLDLYHTALEVCVPDGRFVVENAWPVPTADGAERGVVVVGPVASRWAGRFRVLRYEVRRWRDGTILDIDHAVASPQLVSDDPDVAGRVLDLVDSLPTPTWGRDELDTGDMWNSNSVIAWLLARGGVPMDAITPPRAGRAPGWQAGRVVAARDPRCDGARVGGPNGSPPAVASRPRTDGTPDRDATEDLRHSTAATAVGPTWQATPASRRGGRRARQ